METYYPANGKPDTQNACASLVNNWYPGLNATGENMIVTNGCTQSLMCVMHVCNFLISRMQVRDLVFNFSFNSVEFS